MDLFKCCCMKQRKTYNEMILATTHEVIVSSSTM